MRRTPPDLTIAGVPSALSIAGSDPTGGAGLQLDLQVFRAFGVHGAGVVTALTVQDTKRVHRVLPAFPNVVLDQARTVVRDMTLHAVKVGMLASDDVARMVELALAELRARDAAGPDAPPVVVDPVLAASDGTPLLERRAWPTLLRMLEGAALVTPNLPEAEHLTGLDVSTASGVEAAGRMLVSEAGARAALVKGGHRDGPPDDLLAESASGGVRLRWLAGERVSAGPVHGTGCALSSAVAAGLARREALDAAVASARGFVAAALRNSFAAGSGARLLGL